MDRGFTLKIIITKYTKVVVKNNLTCLTKEINIPEFA